jgi:hypothetical protein
LWRSHSHYSVIRQLINTELLQVSTVPEFHRITDDTEHSLILIITLVLRLIPMDIRTLLDPITSVTQLHLLLLLMSDLQ